MQVFKTIHEVEAVLAQHVGVSAATAGKGITTQRTRELAAKVGNPQDLMKVVHVAGTSGKTSTCYYLAALIRTTGAKVGLTVSPHIETIAERVQINGLALNEDTFCHYFSEFYNLVGDEDNDKASYFELMMVFAYWVFAKENVDYAVIETGMGGLHDSSNIVTRSDKVCVITDIGFDHTQILGTTIEDITTQKAGIIHPDNHVFLYHQTTQVDEVINETVQEKHATVHYVDADDRDTYLERNWILASSTYQYIVERDSLNAEAPTQLDSTKKIRIPGRMDEKTLGGKTVVFDGAHNEQKMNAFAKTFLQKYGDVKPTVVVALKEDKDFQSVVPIIAEYAGQVVVTSFSQAQDLPHRSIDPNVIAAEFQDTMSTTVFNQPYDAMRYALTTKSEVIVVTGSFYLIGELMSFQATA